MNLSEMPWAQRLNSPKKYLMKYPMTSLLRHIGLRTALWIWYYAILLIHAGSLNAAWAQEVPFRANEPIDAVIADLESYIPGRMSEAGVSGLSVALIRHNQVVWTDAFGVTKRWTSRPVFPSTAFEAASISKVVTAYSALRLVDEGRLSLDRSVHEYLKEPWLPRSEMADRITLRHLLSHSSGLGDNTFSGNKEIEFEPGSDFTYSGLGAEYVRILIEQVTGNDLETVATTMVFEPLNMDLSSFVNRASVMDRMAHGHMRYSLILMVALIPFLLVSICLGLMAKILHRIIKKSWRLSHQIKIGLGIVAFILSVWLLYIFIGKSFPNLLWISIISMVVFFILMALSHAFFSRLLSTIKGVQDRKTMKATLMTFFMVIGFAAFLILLNAVLLPVPRNHSKEASAVGSLRSTAPDLARFLVELSDPRYLNENLASQIDSAQVQINGDFSWGLGMGIQHTTHGDALWQNAITFAFRGIMVIYPDEGHGAVVLTNSESGLPVAYDVAERALGGEAKWKYF
jgi:CubicO group peptidase (beta-lactamase class C family)